MIKTILLLSPIYVTLFWSISLYGNEKKHSIPRLFLSKFMLFPLIIYISHFIYFSHLTAIYPYFDVVLQYASLLVFPVYYIYFRLLTVDQNFSFKTHAKFLAVPTLLSFTYAVGVLLTPTIEYRTWLYDEHAYSETGFIQFLSVMRSIIRIVYLMQVVISVTGNFILIRKHGEKAEQFYSDIQDGRYNNANMLNYSIIIMGVAAFTFTLLGRQFLINQDTLIYVGWTVFSIMLFIIGYMGITQKPINPTFDLDTNSEELNMIEELPVGTQKIILKKILALFNEKKIYLDSQLTILDIVKAVGTNRTYISAIINQQYNQNFCSFVNSYRIDELERTILENPYFTYDTLAEYCGFGSVNSLKRAVFAKTGISVSEWKKQLKMKE
jgi:AraC-like DNA-binding protein